MEVYRNRHKWDELEDLRVLSGNRRRGLIELISGVFSSVIIFQRYRTIHCQMMGEVHH